MQTVPPRTRPERVRDSRTALETSIDVWVATATTGEDGVLRPYLVPLSLAWLDERVVVALPADSRTASGLRAAGTARLAVGSTRDVVMIDAVFERIEPVSEATELAERYADRSDWDPREDAGNYVFAVLRPERIQAWRESNELAGRTVMLEGRWLA
jgi:hypothetical protein